MTKRISLLLHHKTLSLQMVTLQLQILLLLGNLTYRYNYSVRQYDFYLRLRFSSADAGKFILPSTPLYTDDGQLNGQTIAYTDYSGGNFNAYIYISSNRYYRPPAVYPIHQMPLLLVLVLQQLDLLKLVRQKCL